MKKRKDFISDIFYSMKISKTTFYKHVRNILTKKQYTIFKMRFDIDGNVKMTSEEIANQLGTTRQDVDGLLNKTYERIIILCKRLNIDVDVEKKLNRAIEYDITDISEKTRELILSIKLLKRLPRLKVYNNNQSERVFFDGTDQRRYYDGLGYDVRRIKSKVKNGEPLTKKEAQKLFDYTAVIEELSKHKVVRRKPVEKVINYSSQIKDLRDKTFIFIEDFNRTHKLPENKYADYFNRGEKFDDGSDKRNFYVALRYKAKCAKEKYARGEKVSDLDKEKIISIKLIDNVLSFYPTKFYNNKLMIFELATSIGIDMEKNKLLLSKAYGEVYAKIRFLIENEIPIIDNDDYVHPIMYMNNDEMMELLNISINDLTNKYVNGVIDSELSQEVVKKLCKK